MVSNFRISVIEGALIAFGLTAAGCGGGGSNERQLSSPERSKRNLTVDLPIAQTIQGKPSLSCRSLMETDLTGSYDRSLTNGLEGKVTLGENKISVLFRDVTTLLFLSEAAFQAGTAVGDEFTIVKDSDSGLVAYLFNGTSMNSFVLNRKNGLAIWSKTRSTFPVYDAPTGGVSYLSCQ
jgi:hypothetical protein